MQNDRFISKVKQFVYQVLFIFKENVDNQSTPENLKNSRFLNIILFTGFCLGILFCIFIPYGAGFDEEQHMLRIYDLSGFNIIPNQEPGNKTLGLSEFFTLSYQRRFFQNSAIDLFNEQNIFTKANYDSMTIAETRSVYSPIMFLPQAFVAGIIWRLFDFPIIPGVILLRITGFLLYVFLIYLSIRFIPAGKWVMAILAFSPTALFQAATVNADGFTNGVSFFFIGYVLFIVTKNEKEIGFTNLLVLICAILLLGFVKPTFSILAFLLVIIPMKKYGSKKKTIAIIASAIIAIVCNFGWSVLVNLDINSGNVNSTLSSTNSGLLGKIDVLFSQPVEFFSLFFSGFSQSAIPRYQSWVGVYGYWVGSVPEIIYWLFPILLIATIVIDSVTSKLDKKTIFWLFITFVLCVFGLSSLRAGLRAVEILTGSDRSMLDSQGRYFVPYMPLLFISLGSLIKKRILFPSWSRKLTIFLFVTILGFYTFGLSATYYTDCGYEYLLGKSCKMPKYKNLEISNAQVVSLNNNNYIKQTFINTCREIENVQIYLKESNSQKGMIQLSLLSTNPSKILTSQIFGIDNIENGSFLTLPFNGFVEKGSEFVIDLKASGLDQSTSVDLGIRPNEVYKGSLTIDDQLLEGDLIFFYTCKN